MAVSLIFPQVCGLRSQAGLGFYLTLREDCFVVNFPQVSGSRSQAGLEFYLTLLENHFVVNFPQVCGREAMQDLGSV